MAATEHTVTYLTVASKGEALWRDAVGRIQDGVEHILVAVATHKQTEEGCLPVVSTEAAEKLGVSGHASLALADGGCTQEGGRLQREAE